MVGAGPPNLPTWKRGCTLGSKIGGHPEGKELIPQKQLRSNRQKSLMDQEHRASMPRIAADDVCRLEHAAKVGEPGGQGTERAAVARRNRLVLNAEKQQERNRSCMPQERPS